MKKTKLCKLFAFIFTLCLLVSLTVNTMALTNDRMGLSTNIPDRAVDRENGNTPYANRRDRATDTGIATDTDITPDETRAPDTEAQTGVLDEALTKASEALNDVTSALGDLRDDVADTADDMDAGSSFLGVVIAILIAAAIIILVIVMVSKNGEKNNRKH